MNQFKSLPWTQILLALLLLSNIANLIEMRRIKKATEDVHSAIYNTAGDASSSDASSDAMGINNSIDTGNEILERIDKRVGCIEDRYRPGCTIPLSTH